MGLAVSRFSKPSVSSCSVSGRISKQSSKKKGNKKALKHAKKALDRSQSHSEESEAIPSQETEQELVESVSTVRLGKPDVIVGRLVQVYWDCCNAWLVCILFGFLRAWLLFQPGLTAGFFLLRLCSRNRFDCEVQDYAKDGPGTGKHLVKYFDEIQEWRKIEDYRVVDQYGEGDGSDARGDTDESIDRTGED